MRAKKHLEEKLGEILEKKGWAWPDKANIEPPKDKKFGDLATNAAMMLSREAGMNPRQIAEEIAQAFASDPDIDRVEIAGPGFLNFHFTPDFWRRIVPVVLGAGDEYGRSSVGAGKKVQVEYVSANPTGPLHIGHGRGAALGDALARLLRATGHEVETEYYVNDAGRQMKILGGSIYYRLQQAQGLKPAEPEDYYKGDYIKDLADDVFAAHPDIMDKSEDEGVEICKDMGMSAILDGIKKDLEDFCVEHQVWFSEKSLVSTGRVDATFDRLRKNGLAYDQEGALWFRSTEFKDDKDRVLKKSNGDLTYFASDIAYHDDKYQRGFDLVVDIWGADHHGYVPRMEAAVSALGLDSAEQFRVILVQLVNLLKGGEQIAMSTRAGKFETLADVVAEVGADAARFIFLSRKSDSPLDFDLELVKQKTMDNPVYYVQYAHARICSLMGKATEMGVAIPTLEDADLTLLNTEADLDVLTLADQYPDVLESAAKGLSPHQVSFYLRELASALHRYYTMNPVLNQEPELRKARMLLLQAVAQILKNGLGVLGVSAPERM